MDKIDICNAALARLGEARIQALTDGNTAGRACTLLYPLALEEMLRGHRWNFATKRAVLTRLVEDPLFGPAYAYTLPTDCVRVLEVNDVSGSGPAGQQWEIEDGKLLCDDDEVRVLYIRRIEDSNVLDALATEALVLLLAAKLAPAIQGGSTSKAEALMNEYVRLCAPLARRVDANESRRGAANMMTQMMRGSLALGARGGGV